ncbi:MAG: SCO1664 family protein [Chloroflexi bacterium]|nr:MAG: SCO1664 family protein [Chloroflexota bacterium]
MGRDPSSEPPVEELSFEEAERRLLACPEVAVLGLLPNSSNYTFLARVSGPGGEILAVYKPARGESPLWDFPSGTLHRREVASYRLARFLSWPAIPPTVTRKDAPMGVGALQVFVESRPGEDYFKIRQEREKELLPVALFDVIANNADRKAGHCLLDPQGRLWVIDHGLTFHADPKLRTVIWNCSGQRLPARLRGDLERGAESLEAGPLAAELSELVSRRELAVLRRRLTAVLEPGWRFPSPTSGWSVPWPPV